LIVTENLLSDDHADVDALLTDLSGKLEHGTAADALNALDLFWARLAMHIRAEHLHLFPAVLKINSETDISEILESLRRDHDFFMHELADLMKAMRSIITESESEVMRDTSARLEAIKDRLAKHNALEEERIYPLQRRLSASESEQLARSVAKELSNLPPRFSKGE
jgi:iron-sulfur cluster repair protein YtfE (RIC family)